MQLQMARPPGPASHSLGGSWLELDESAVLKVPSVVIPEEHNYLINPAHPDFEKICVGELAEEVCGGPLRGLAV
jgi:RES domain-containing protein